MQKIYEQLVNKKSTHTEPYNYEDWEQKMISEVMILCLKLYTLHTYSSAHNYILPYSRKECIWSQPCRVSPRLV